MSGNNKLCEHDGKCLDGASGLHCREWEENNLDTPTNTPTSKCCEKCDAEMWDGPKGKCYSDYKCSCHTPTTDSKNTTGTDWETTFREKDFERILNGNAPITDMISFIKQTLASQKEELRGEVEKMKYGQPLLGTPESTEQLMVAVDTTLDEVLRLLTPKTD